MTCRVRLVRIGLFQLEILCVIAIATGSGTQKCATKGGILRLDESGPATS